MVATTKLSAIVRDGEAWLTQRVIHYAKTHGYTPFTSTLEQAWRASIHGLSAPLLVALGEGRSFSAVAAEADYSRDPIAYYGIEAARRHRTRGVTLGLFLGLMKSYRRSYLDLVEAADGLEPGERTAFSEIIGNFFDRMEVGFCDEWASKPADEQFEQLRAQSRATTNEKNKYLTIFESLNDPVVLLGEDGAVENMNFAAASLFGREETPGAGYYRDGPPALPADLLAGIAACARRGGPCEFATRRGNRWFDVRTQRMLDVSEKYLGTVVILVDVTETLRARDAAEQANRAKSAFLATMSHEIRTPIHGILGAADLLLKADLPERDRPLVEAIVRSGEVLASGVSDILDYSKIEAGAVDIERIEFQVADVVDDVAGVMRPLVARKGDLDLVVELPALPPVVGDPAKLRQILVNLVGNAVKFTEAGTVWLAIEDVSGPGEAHAVAFTVADTGIGIAADRLDAVFAPFAQADTSIGRRYGGTGLGLAICRRMVDLLGGRLDIDSRLGEGTRITVTLPLPRGAGQPVAGSAPPAPLRPLDVLVVEDNDVNALVAGGLLARAGHRPVRAASGAAALEALGAQRFDVVLMDLRLPDLDGIEVTRRIRAHADPAAAAVPVVALSAQLLLRDVQACRAAGMNDVLGKPFRYDRLERVLRRVTGADGAAEPAREAETGGRTGVAAIRPRPVPEPVAPAAEAGPAVDEQVLAAHLSVLGLDETRSIVAAFRSSLAAMPTDLERAATERSLPAIGALAHRLKGASAHVGLSRLAARAAAVETASRAGDPLSLDAARQLADALRRAAGDLDGACDRLFAEAS